MPTTGGTKTTMDYYEENTFTITLSGIWASNHTGTARFVRSVILFLPSIEATTNSSGYIVVTGIPSRLAPSNIAGCFIRVKNSGSILTTPGWFDFLGGPSYQIYRDCANSVGFSSGSTCGITSNVFSYLLN